MASPIQSYKVIAKGGLNTSQNYLDLSDQKPGSAVRLVNFESALTGGYRRINGFRKYDVNHGEVTSATAPAEGPVLGVFGFENTTTGILEIYAARKQIGSATYRFYLYTPTGWVEQTTGITHVSAGVSVVRAETFNFGVGNIIIFVDGINHAVTFDGTDWRELTSSGLGTDASPGGDQILDAPSIIANFKNHVFLGGDRNYPGVVCHSAPNDHLDWTSASGGGQIVINFPVIQIKPFRDELFVFGYTAIKRVIVNSTTFVLQDVTSNLGCIARDSVVEVAGNILFLSSDGIRNVAGTAKIGDVDLSAISDPVTNTINDIQQNYDLTNLRSVIIRKKTQFRYFIADAATDVAEAYGFLGTLTTKSSEGVTWEFGELMGIRANCTWSGYNGSDELVLHGDYDGNVFRQEIGTSFNGANITAIYTTPYLDFGDTEIRKRPRMIHTYTKAEGPFEIDLAVRYDWDNTDIVNPTDYSDVSSDMIAAYDSGFTYDGGAVYSGSRQPIFHTHIQGSGFATQFSFVSDGVFSSFTIQGFVIEFSTNGRQ